jgi:N-acetylneuraminic acid mutarotase
MIVWGGCINNHPNYLNAGSRYDPTTDLWTEMSRVNAPVGRRDHVAVWTGSEMIIWAAPVAPVRP